MRAAILGLIGCGVGLANLFAETADPLPLLRKGDVLKGPYPKYPYEARARHITGKGILILHVDRAKGIVTSVSIQKSTGHKILDDAAVEAFRQWRFKPEAVKANRVRMPVRFFMAGDKT